MIIDVIIYILLYYRILSIYYLYYDFIWFPSFSTVLSVYMSNYVCFNMFKKSPPKLPNEKIFKERTSMAPTTIGAYRWGERVRSWLNNWDKPPEHSWLRGPSQCHLKPQEIAGLIKGPNHWCPFIRPWVGVALGGVSLDSHETPKPPTKWMDFGSVIDFLIRELFWRFRKYFLGEWSSWFDISRSNDTWYIWGYGKCVPAELTSILSYPKWLGV